MAKRNHRFKPTPRKAEAPAAETNGRAAKAPACMLGSTCCTDAWADWLRMRNLAGDEGTSLQALFLRA